MSRSIGIAHHLIWTAYGWWLPNDPRGALSHAIRNDILAQLGELHQGRTKVQPTSAAFERFYRECDSALKYELREFEAGDVRNIAGSFADTIRGFRYTYHACAVLPDHVHMVIRKHKYIVEKMIEHFRQGSRLRLRAKNHPVWGGPGRKVFLEHPDDVRQTMR